MAAKKSGALASALRSSGATVAFTRDEAWEAPQAALAAPSASPVAPSRVGTVPITGHFPAPVRRQLKAMSAEEGRNMQDMLAEALNLLFAKYRRPEIAPRKADH